MTEPTIAEKHLAKTIALYHGSQVVCYGGNLGPGAHTVANFAFGEHGGYRTPEYFAEKRWQEYLGAARAVLSQR